MGGRAEKRERTGVGGQELLRERGRAEWWGGGGVQGWETTVSVGARCLKK